MEKIKFFSEKWKVVEFSLFGSVLRDDFRSDSDIDVLLSFEKNPTWDLYDLVDMKDELHAIFGRKIDLVEKESVRNPYRRRAMLTEQEVLYAA
jgi:predicted nucleotidyltransferase